MLQLMNELADYAHNTHNISVLIKCHCSAGQQCTDYTDPRDPTNSTKLNFNFLPMMASENLGILPHTVQAYSLDDPTAGVYNNRNFEYMLDWMLWEAGNSSREVVFHPETNYWVNVDIDVPLFLPVCVVIALFVCSHFGLTYDGGGAQLMLSQRMRTSSIPLKRNGGSTDGDPSTCSFANGVAGNPPSSCPSCTRQSLPPPIMLTSHTIADTELTGCTTCKRLHAS
jgi:hypothetical protein